MLVLEKYDVVRVHNNRLAIGTSSFSRGENKDDFLASLQQTGFKLRKENGEEVFLKALGAELTYSIGDAEVLIIEIDSELDEQSLK